MKINWVYHDNYDIPLKENHRFTSTKFSDLFTVLKNSKLHENAIINNPSAADLSDLTIAQYNELACQLLRFYPNFKILQLQGKFI